MASGQTGINPNLPHMQYRVYPLLTQVFGVRHFSGRCTENEELNYLLDQFVYIWWLECIHKSKSINGLL